MDVDVVPVCSPQLHAKRRIKTPSDIATYPLLHQMSRPTRWAEWMKEAGVTLDGMLSGHTYEQFSMIAQAAAAGLGVALLPVFMLEEELASGKLEIVSDQFMATQTSYFLIIPETRASAGAIKQFADWLISQARAASATDVSGRRKAVARKSSRKSR
jgi:LysR family glycine cleavage system transcriptional activator